MDSVKLPDTRSTNKNQLFLYTDNVLSVKEKTLKIPFAKGFLKMKYLGVNLNEWVALVTHYHHCEKKPDRNKLGKNYLFWLTVSGC
jgi:hypothetical protein